MSSHFAKKVIPRDSFARNTPNNGNTSGSYDPHICLAVGDDIESLSQISALHVNNLPCDPPEELETAIEYPEDAEEYKVSISPNNVIFDFEVNDADTKTETINISNGGYLGSVIEWSASTESEWLTVSKTSGLTTDSITLTADKSNLEKGLYQALVEFTSPETDDSEFLIAYLEIYDETTSNPNPPGGQGMQIFLPFITDGNSANPPGNVTPAPPTSTFTPTPTITPTSTPTNTPVVESGPDLVITKLEITSITSSSIAYEYTIKNVGNAPANLDGPTNDNSDNVSVQAFLSDDQIFNNSGDSPAGGTILGPSPLGNLNPNESFTGSFSASGDNPPSWNYLTLKVDWGEQVYETNEANNTFATAITPRTITPTITPTSTPTQTPTITPTPTATNTPTAEAPQIPITTPLQLINQKSDKCIDTFLAQTHNSVKPIQFTCAETASFFWRIVSSDDSGYYRVIHQQSGRCLSPANSSNEEWSRLHIYDCDNNDEAHKWAIEPQGNAFQIRNKHSNLCIDTYLGSVEDWTELIQFSCTGADSLQWRFDTSVVYPGDLPEPNRFRLRNRWNPYCLASIGNSKEVDNNVGMGTCESSNSIWSWDGEQLRNEWNPYCLASIGNSQDIDNNVVMGTCNQSNGIWFWADGNHLRNGWHPSCLGSIGNSQAVDNNVVMGTCDQLNAEWYVEYVP